MPRRIAKRLIICPVRQKINDARNEGRGPEAIGRMVTHYNSQQQVERADFFCRVRDAFRVFARRSSEVLGTAWAFIGAIVIIAVWAMTGPMFHFSDTWQLIINTGTTIVTFLMVFLIQNTQNRDAKAVHLKLDELIRALRGARNNLVDLEKLSDEELKKLEEQFTHLRERAQKTVERVPNLQKSEKT
jgi:low affinity Fe/Cu permease